jgi:5-carboxymethyl-2-hydroxymuconate isomerase
VTDRILPDEGQRGEALDQAIEQLDDPEPCNLESSVSRRVGATHRAMDDMNNGLVGFTHPTIRIKAGRSRESRRRLDEHSITAIDSTRNGMESEPGQRKQYDVSAALALAATVVRGIYLPAADRKRRIRALLARTPVVARR